MDEDGGISWSTRGDEDEEKQGSSDVEEPEEKQRRGEQDEAVHKQPREHTKTRRAQDWNIRGKTRRRGPSETTTKGGGRRHDTPRTRTSGAEQAAGAGIPRTGTTVDKWRPSAPDWIVRGGPSSRTRRPPDWSIQGPAAVDAPRTGTSGAEQAAGAKGSLRSGHEDEAVEMQRSRVEDEAGEKRRKQDGDKAKVTQ